MDVANEILDAIEIRKFVKTQRKFIPAFARV